MQPAPAGGRQELEPEQPTSTSTSQLVALAVGVLAILLLVGLAAAGSSSTGSVSALASTSTYSDPASLGTASPAQRRWTDSVMATLTAAKVAALSDDSLRKLRNAVVGSPALLVDENLRRGMRRSAATARADSARSAHDAAVKAKSRARNLLAEARAFRFASGERCTRASPARVQRLLDRHPEWDDSDMLTVACGAVRVGMTAAQVAASWGRPESINRSAFSFGVHEQWVYGAGNYVFLEDGVVTSVSTASD